MNAKPYATAQPRQRTHCLRLLPTTTNTRFAKTPTWKKQQLYLNALKAQSGDLLTRRAYFPITQRSDILPSSGPGTSFDETTRDMKFREQLERKERGERAKVPERPCSAQLLATRGHIWPALRCWLGADRLIDNNIRNSYFL